MTTAEHPPGPRQDDVELAEFGYRPGFERTLGNFHTFTAGISHDKELINRRSARAVCTSGSP
ncbi:hypothetical protein [Streptomyces zaehneri]|uniref:hypothetical protein n=1 Tax=Streptomyces zaehneri TaxID=3051180 RepID=UPI0028D76E99|nr:hypothetical protein [Streptomyces sp. DSM 40713]